MRPRRLLGYITAARVRERGWRNVVRILMSPEAEDVNAAYIGVTRRQLYDAALGKTDLPPEAWLKAEELFGIPAFRLRELSKELPL